MVRDLIYTLFKAIYGEDYRAYESKYGKEYAVRGVQAVCYLIENLGWSIDDDIGFSINSKNYPYSLCLHIYTTLLTGNEEDLCVKSPHYGESYVLIIKQILSKKPDTSILDSFWLSIVSTLHFLHFVKRLTWGKAIKLIRSEFPQYSMMSENDLKCAVKTLKTTTGLKGKW